MCVIPNTDAPPTKRKKKRRKRAEISKGELWITDDWHSMKVAWIILQDLDYVHKLKEDLQL